MRSEGYDRNEVDAYVAELQGEIVEQRRALETATQSAQGDTRLHDPEGAVTRTLAIAQETADRVLHDAQIEADRRRVAADEHSTTVIAEADERAARLLSDMEAQAAEVREQGVAAARSAIQVERDKAMAELAHVRRVRDDLRTEAVDLKAALDRYRSQAREASDTLAAASSGPLMSLDLPDFIDDEVVLAGISSGEDDGGDEAAATYVADQHRDDEAPAESGTAFGAALEEPETALLAGEDTSEPVEDTLADLSWADSSDDATEASLADETSHLRAVDDPAEEDDTEAVDDDGDSSDEAPDESEGDLAEVLEFGADPSSSDEDAAAPDEDAAAPDEDDGGGTFLAEVRAAADVDDAGLAPEGEESDRFLSELRGLTDDADDVLDSDAADTFFDND